MTGFIGRQGELRVLTEAYEGSGSAFIPIYGRRRVGKSELILRFMARRRAGAGRKGPWLPQPPRGHDRPQDLHPAGTGGGGGHPVAHAG